MTQFSGTAVGQIPLTGDRDTCIIKGVLAVLIHLIGCKSARAIEQLDVDEFYMKFDLEEHLAPSRHIGVYAIVELMKQQVRHLLAISNYNRLLKIFLFHERKHISYRTRCYC